MKAKGYAVPMLTAAIGIGLAAPSAEACFFLFRKNGESKQVHKTEKRQVEQRPLAGPPPEQCAKLDRPLAGPPPAFQEERIDADSAKVVKCKTRWVEAVYETREKKVFRPAVLETRVREIQVPAVYQMACRQEWVAPVYKTICSKEFIAPTYKTITREVKEECQYKDVTFQKYIPAKVRTVVKARCIADGKGGFTTVEDVDYVIDQPAKFETVTERRKCAEGGSRMINETVMDQAGYWKEHMKTVLVTPGHYRNVEEKVCSKPAAVEKVTETIEVQPARVETVKEKVLIMPGHWEEVSEEVTKTPC